jgi:hypothetical protein
MRLIDRVPSRAYPYKWISADVCDRPSLMAAVEGCTMLYNLAAEHRDDVPPATLYHDVNVTRCRAPVCRRRTAPHHAHRVYQYGGGLRRFGPRARQ